jgi:hypothetical protein
VAAGACRPPRALQPYRGARRHRARLPAHHSSPPVDQQLWLWNGAGQLSASAGDGRQRHGGWGRPSQHGCRRVAHSTDRASSGVPPWGGLAVSPLVRPARHPPCPADWSTARRAPGRGAVSVLSG